MHCPSFASRVAVSVFALILLTLLGELLLSVFFFAPTAGAEWIGSLVWYVFSLSSGFLASGLPFALPFVLLFAPVIRREGLTSGLAVLTALSFGLLLSLSLFGAGAGWVGREGFSLLGAPVAHLRDWVSIFSGLFVYILALGEIGLIKTRISTFGAAAPRFTQRKRMIVSAFLMGLFLGSVGIGSISPAIPLLLIQSASSANPWFGAALFAMHAVGRIVFLFLFALLFAYGVDTLRWITTHGERFVRFNGWLLVLAGSFLMTLGLFSHGWWEVSLLHAMLVPSLLVTSLGSGLFPLSYALGGAFWAILVLLPIWWHFVREYHRVYGTPALEMQHLSDTIDRLVAQRRHLEVIAHLPHTEHGKEVTRIEREIDTLETKRRVLEDAARYGAKSGMRDALVQQYEEEELRLRRNLYLAVTVLLALFGMILL